ncbi:MAG: PAS domain S-box protein [Chitinophagaceae bacterium]|nr:MAG: PAS domain S-box protein [Chitinophagaceae bacterium]
MNQIQLDFEQARTKHLLFKSRLRSILYGLPIDEAPVLSAAECSLGKWMDSHAHEAYGHIPEMRQAEQLHLEIHKEAGRLVERYRQGNVEAARAGLLQIEKSTDRLAGLLSEVEQKITAESATSAEADSASLSDYFRELSDLAKDNDALDRVIRSQSGKLVAERQTLYDVLMQLPATIAVLKGPDHVFEMANPSFLAGFAGKEVIGKTVREVLPSLEGQGFFELVNHVYQTGEPFTGNEMRIEVKLDDGTVVEGFINLNYQALRNQDGQIDGVISFSYNVTEAVQARRKAEENEERFRFMSDAMPVQTWTANKDGVLKYVNQGWESYFGKSAEQLLEEGWGGIVFPADLPLVKEKWRAASESNTTFETELRLKHKDGQYRWHLARAAAFTGADKQLTWYGTNTDIHDMKSLQEQIRQSYEDLEVKVKFRNIELERTIRDLQKELETLRPQAS